MFFRLKLVAILLGVVLVLLAAVYLMFLRPIGNELTEALHRRVAVASEAVEAINRGDDYAIRHNVERLAQDDELRRAMTCEPALDAGYCLEQRHREVLVALDGWHRRLQSTIAQMRDAHLGGRSLFSVLSGEPSLLIVADADGTVVGRTLGDVAFWYGESVINLSQEYTVVADALTNRRTTHDVIGWTEEGRALEARQMMLVAASPIYDWLPGGARGEVNGVALVGYAINDSVAADKSSVLADLSIIYLLDDSVAASNLAPGALRSLESSVFVTSGDPTRLSFLELASRGRPNVAYEASGDGELVVALGRFSHDRVGQEAAGFLVVAALPDGLSPLSGAALGLPLLGLLILVIAVVAMILIVRGFLAPLVKLDQGIQQVIAGNRDYRFEVDSKSPFHAEMANALNAMSAYLQDKPLPDEETPADDREWEALLQFAEVELAGPSAPAKADDTSPPEGSERVRRRKALAEEPRDHYHQRIFEQYAAARQQVGAGGKGLTYERFVHQVKKNAETFKRRHRCRDVRFEVVVRNDKVVLKPIPIY